MAVYFYIDSAPDAFFSTKIERQRVARRIESDLKEYMEIATDMEVVTILASSGLLFYLTRFFRFTDGQFRLIGGEICAKISYVDMI